MERPYIGAVQQGRGGHFGFSLKIQKHVKTLKSVKFFIKTNKIHELNCNVFFFIYNIIITFVQTTIFHIC